MKFVAFDFETANADQSSICSAGFAVFENGIMSENFEVIIDPDDYFDPYHVSIHGIGPEHVVGHPKFHEFYPNLCDLLRETTVIHHTHFDLVALKRALDKHNLEHIECKFIDSAALARRAWKHCAYSGYGLSVLAKENGIDFAHHNAAEDARACGLIFIKSMEQMNISFTDVQYHINQPLPWTKPEKIKLKRTPDKGEEFGGDTVVFTGKLSMERSECANLAAAAGFAVGSGVTAQTTILVVGIQDIRRLNGAEKSSKHIKAEKLANKGQAIRIIGEDDFIALISSIRS